MSVTTKKQPYKYTSKNVTFSMPYQSGSSVICGGGAELFIIPPKDALTIENLTSRIVVQFDASVPVEKRVLKRFGITIGTGGGAWWNNDRSRLIEVNKAADASRVIDMTLNLTPFLKKDAVAYRNQLLTLSELDYDCMYITAEFLDDQMTFENVNGAIKLWKAEALYTTVGIQ